MSLLSRSPSQAVHKSLSAVLHRHCAALTTQADEKALGKDDSRKYAIRSSVSSVSDPVFDYLSQPYERPQRPMKQPTLSRSVPSSMTSFSDPAYDYMQQTYDRPLRGRGSITSPPSLIRDSK